MYKKTGRLILVLFLFCYGFGQTSGTVSILPLDQIREGMKGKGKSVFEGKKIEEFEVEILGVLRNFQPNKNLVLARLKGGILDKAGVISGMSGSPVYINGKLVGAIAYSFPYSKEAIAGITPIGEMLQVAEERERTSSYFSSFSSTIPFKKSLSLDDLFELQKEFFSSNFSSFAGNQSFVPLDIPLVFSGFSSGIFEKVKPFFTRLGFSPIRTGTVGQKQKPLAIPDLSLREGDPVGIQLVGGDLNLSAVGTVTYVDGKKILAFGHPLFNLGRVDYAMTKAEVLTVVPSISTSFKIANTDILVGKFSQDRNSGVYGEIGKMPQFLPLNIKIKGHEGDTKEFKLKIVNDKFLSPSFVFVSLLGVLSSEERAYGDLSLELQGNVYLENGQSIYLEDLYSGNFNSSVESLSGLIAAVVYFLSNNEFKELGIHRIDISISATEDIKFSYLERIWLDKYEASPGEKIRIRIYSRTFRGQSTQQDVQISAPHLPAGSDFYLLIGDAVSMYEMESRQYKSKGFVPRSLNQLIRILNNLRKNNRIYFKVIAAKPGLFLKGEEMPNLPLTMKSMFSSPRASATSPVELKRSTLRDYQLPVPYVFKGTALIPLKIRE